MPFHRDWDRGIVGFGHRGATAGESRCGHERVGPERTISVVHTDLPENDFKAHFRLLESDPDSYLRNDPTAFASAIGRSFYQQILPAASVTLGWSTWAVPWLSRAPATIPDHVQVACSGDNATRAAFAKQADDDWRTFLSSWSGSVLRRDGGWHGRPAVQGPERMKIPLGRIVLVKDAD